MLETDKIFFFLLWERWLPQPENEFRNTTWTHLESQHGWSLLGPSGPSPAPAGTLRAGCSGLCPSSFWWPSRRRFPNLSGKTVWVLCHLHSAEGLPDAQSELPVFQSVPIASCSGTGHHWREPGSVLFAHSIQMFVDIDDTYSPSPSLACTVPVLSVSPASNCCTRQLQPVSIPPDCPCLNSRG